MKVTFEIPDREWYALAGRAEKHGLKVADLLSHAVRDALGAEAARVQKERDRQERVVLLAREGLTDAVICERTGETREFVTRMRRRAGIKANRQYRSETEGKTA